MADATSRTGTAASRRDPVSHTRAVGPDESGAVSRDGRGAVQVCKNLCIHGGARALFGPLRGRVGLR